MRRLDAIVLASEPRAGDGERGDGGGCSPTASPSSALRRLPWSKAQIQLRDRVGFLRAAGERRLAGPDRCGARRDASRTWLAPFLAGKTRLAEIGADDLGAALDALLPWT